MPSICAPATVELAMPSIPESVALVRAGVKGFGSVLQLDRELLDDLQMVASEACNNVVMHAYTHPPGPLTVQLEATAEGIELRVRDYGRGLAPQPSDAEPAGLGLTVIQSLSDETEYTEPPTGGTELRMRFVRPIPDLAPPEPIDDAPLQPVPFDANAPLPVGLVATVSPIPVMSGVLGRVARALAAQARFSVDRFADLNVLVDSLTKHVQRSASSSRVSFALGAETRRLMLRVGPLRRDAGGSPAAVPEPLPRYADEVRLEPFPGGAILALAMTERSRPAV